MEDELDFEVDKIEKDDQSRNGAAWDNQKSGVRSKDASERDTLIT